MKHHCPLPPLCTPALGREGAQMPTCLLLSSKSVSKDGSTTPREAELPTASSEAWSARQPSAAGWVWWLRWLSIFTLVVLRS